MRFGLLYPLLAHDTGGAELLERVVGEVGIDELVAVVIGGPAHRVRLNPCFEPATVRTPGGWFYPPDREAYHASAVRPRTAPGVGKRNPLAALAEQARRLDLRLTLRVDLRAAQPLLEHDPHLAMRNCFSDPEPTAGACPSHPELRELLRCALDELAGYEPAGFELADLWPHLACDRDQPRPLDFDPHVRALLDTCFCPACRTIAERDLRLPPDFAANQHPADADAAARSVRVQIEHRLAGRPVEPDPLVGAYRDAITADLLAWLARLAERHQSRERWLALPATLAGRVPADAGWRPVCDHGARGADRPPADATAVVLPCWRPVFDSASALVRETAARVEAGCERIVFAGLDEAPEDAIDWLRQAVRYARRGASNP